MSPEVTVTFIKLSNLGVLEGTVKQVNEYTLKRDRAAGLKRAARILHDLNLIPYSLRIVGLSLGSDVTGERGLFIVTEKRTTVKAEMPS